MLACLTKLATQVWSSFRQLWQWTEILGHLALAKLFQAAIHFVPTDLAVSIDSINCVVINANSGFDRVLTEPLEKSSIQQDQTLRRGV
jgi:hypothetical protein